MSADTTCHEALERLGVRLAAFEERDRWVLVSERLPRQFQPVEFVQAGKRSVNHGSFELYNGVAYFETSSWRYGLRDVLCWRPARPVGELPIPKESP